VDEAAGSTSREMAQKLDIPFNHMAKLVQRLRQGGYLLTKKGKGGGLKLATDPREISLAEVVAAIEGPLVVSDCIFKRHICKFSSSCKVRVCLSMLRRQMDKILSGTTIYDLAPM